MNGWWRITIALMVLTILISGYRAVDGVEYIGTAQLPYSPPTNFKPTGNPFLDAAKIQPDPFLAAMDARADADPRFQTKLKAYDAKYQAKLAALSDQIATSSHCLPWTVTHASGDNGDGIKVSCRTTGSALNILLGGVCLCAIIAGLAWVIGWIAAGFKRSA